MNLIAKLLRVEWLLGKLQAISNWLFSAVGLLLLCCGLVTSALVEHKELAVALTFAATLVGTAILSLMLPKALKEIIDDEREKAILLEEKLKAEKEAWKDKEKLRAAEREIERLRNERVSVDQIEPMLKLALISVPCQRTDFVLETVKTAEATKLNRKEELEYLGVFNVDYTQILGVDLNRLRFRKSFGNVVEVSGLAETELVGVIKQQTFPLAGELRKHCTEGSVLPDSHEILTHDPDGIHGWFNKRKQKQLDDIEAEIKRPKEGKVVNEAIGKMALQFLTTYFQKAGITLVRATSEFDGGKTLAQICDDHNARVGQLVSAKYEEVRELEARLTETENDLREDVKREFARPLATHG